MNVSTTVLIWAVSQKVPLVPTSPNTSYKGVLGDVGSQHLYILETNEREKNRLQIALVGKLIVKHIPNWF